MSARAVAPPAWFDSHSHLQERYTGAHADGDIPTTSPAAELERAWLAGVRRVVCVGTDAVTSEQAVALARDVRSGALGQDVPELFATVGLHPHAAAQGIDATVAVLDAAAAAGPGTGPVVAIGECGLDYHYDHSPRRDQREVFAAQVALAEERGLALVVHARDAWDDLFDLLASSGVPERSVLHCFTGGPQEARRCLDLGMYLSFSGIVTFKGAPEVREAAALCPLDRTLVETDAPYLAPVPFRGRPNEPAYVSLVGVVIAEVKQLPVELVAEATAASAAEAFALVPSDPV